MRADRSDLRAAQTAQAHQCSKEGCGMTSKDGRVPDGTGLSQAEPQEGLGPTGFDPSRWNELFCALANARYALEFWEREAAVAARHGVPIPSKLHEWAVER